jgi:hypothetical protein
MDDSRDISASVELAIVDVFTKLIFGVEQPWGDQELSIMRALREADHRLYMDSNHSIGRYLRALGVQEMISLVSRVKIQLLQGTHLPPDRVTPKRAAGSLV